MPAIESRPPTETNTPPPAGAFEAAFDHAATGMALVGPDGRVRRANPALCRMLGYTEDEMRRLPPAAIFHPDDLYEEAASRAALAAGREPTVRRELRLRDRAGLEVWVSLTRVLVRGEEGQPAHFIDQVHDLTERRRAEKEIVLLNNLLEQRIQRRTAELEESNEDLRDFAYSLAHDLRGPLASIDGFSAQLQQQLRGQLDSRSARFLQRIRAGVQQMAQLTDGLLALADIARTELLRQPVDLSELARAAAHRLAELEPQRQVDVRVEDTPPAEGDGRLLGCVMENLIGNAWKFTGKRADACIAFSARLGDDGRWCYQVSDNGAGFDPAFAKHLFSPFHRLHTAEEFEGTGIGLAMVRKIIWRHGGRIWADSRPGEGATFWFTLGERPPTMQGDSGY
jgi:PAS domain S-box-containing protein